MGCSTRVSGTGYVMSSELVKEGWKYVSLTEDWELTADQILQSHKIAYCDDAVFYDEQPVSIKIMFRQRLRWQLGHLLVFKEKYRDIIVALFSREYSKNMRFSLYDLSSNIFPFCTLMPAVFLLKLILYLLAPVFGVEMLPALASLGKEYMFSFGQCYLTLLGTILLLYISQKEKISKIKPLIFVPACLIFPLFFFLSFPLEWISLFLKNLTWKPIPHTGRSEHF